MKKVAKFMDSGEVQVFLGVLLMLSLFLSDSWIVGNAPDSQNEGLYAVLTVVVFFFTAEVCILSYVTDGYFNSFFFWMDFLGTVSILLDIGWVSDTFLGGQSVKSGSVLRATRAAKLGARYGRILRLMKLIKFTKWCPCLQTNVTEDVKTEPTLSAVVKISSELTGTISRRVALLVVSIVIIVPFLAYSVTDYSAEAYIQVLQTMARQSSCTTVDMELYMDKFAKFYTVKDVQVRQITVNSPYYTCGGTLDSSGNTVTNAVQTPFHVDYLNNNRHTRTGNLIEYIDDYTFEGTSYDVSVTVDSTIPYQWSALYGIILMILVIGVLFGFSASFHSSIETLVVVPLQKLMSTLRKSATVMIDSLKSLEKEKKDEEKQKKKEEAEKAGTKPGAIPEDEDSDEDSDDEDAEAAMLESLVEKLAKIVKHVLPASNDIVATNDENVDKATADWLNQQYTSGNNN